MNKVLAGLFFLFTATLFGCGGGGSGVPAASVVSGTASQGAAVAAGTIVTLKDAKGVKATTTVGANGSYSIVVDGLTAPFVLNAGGMYSYAAAAGITNINPFTHLTMQIALGASTISDTTVIPTGFAALYAVAVTKLMANIDALYPSTVAAGQKDFLNGAIVIGAWVDKIFDSIVITAPNASGNFTVSVGGQQILTGSTTNGVVVMTPIATAMTYVGATLFPVATTNMAFTTVMVSGKTFSFTTNENTTGTFTFYSDGTCSLTNQSSGNTAAGKWAINATGQLLVTVTSGQSTFIGEVDIFALTASTAATFSATNVWTEQTGVTGNLNATFTFSSLAGAAPTTSVGGYTLQAGETAATNLTASMVSGQTFYWGDAAAANYGEIIFSADSTGIWTGLATTTFNSTIGWVATALLPNAMPIIVTSTSSTGSFAVDTLNIVALGSSYYVVSDMKANSTGVASYRRFYYGSGALANAKAYSGN